MRDEYVEHYIETRNYIPFFKEQNGEYLYLKDYSKVVRGIGNNGLQANPEKFEDENITLIENPTQEDKIILAANLTPFDTNYLGAIVRGKSMLETMSKEEAISTCDNEKEKMIEKILFGEENDNERRMNRLTKAYLDGSLYTKSKKALEIFADSTIKVEELKREKQEVEVPLETEKEAVVATQQESVVPEVQLPQQEIEDEKTYEKAEEESKSELQPVLSVEIPTVAEEQTAPLEVQPSQEPAASVVPTPVPESTISPDAYNALVADVVNGESTETSLGLQEATDLLEQPVVPVMPQVPEVSQVPLSQQVPAQPAVQDIAQAQVASVVPVPDSLTEMTSMAEDMAAPSFDGSLGGRGM